jgi:acyl dehydratase
MDGFIGDIGGTIKSSGPVIGAFAECTHSFSQEDVDVFAALCGDNNPLHVDPVVAAESMFGGTIVHGILGSSLISTLFGRSLHGAIYVSQSLSFHRPMHVGSVVQARVEILNKESKRSGHLLTCATLVLLEDGRQAIAGEAKCLLPYTHYPKLEEDSDTVGGNE